MFSGSGNNAHIYSCTFSLFPFLFRLRLAIFFSLAIISIFNIFLFLALYAFQSHNPQENYHCSTSGYLPPSIPFSSSNSYYIYKFSDYFQFSPPPHVILLDSYLFLPPSLYAFSSCLLLYMLLSLATVLST